MADLILPVKRVPKPVYTPYPKQNLMHESEARFRIICAGVRSGKTFACIQEIVKYCAEHRNSMVWWVSLSYDVALRGFDTFKTLFPESSPTYQKHIEKTLGKPLTTICFKNGSRVEFRSADKPSSLVGIGLDFLVVDEAAFIADDVWYHYLRARLTDRNGRAIVISSPEYKNWFYDLCQRGKDPTQENYEYFHWKTADNIYIPNLEQEIEQARQDLAEEEFRNLYEAEFLEEDSAVFKGMEHCILEDQKVQNVGSRWFVEEKADQHKRYLYNMGVDVAKGGKDFTVITVCKFRQRSTYGWEKRVVYLERIKEDSLLIQGQRIWEVWKKFGRPKIYIDATSIGSALVDEFSRAPNIISKNYLEPIVFQKRNKPEIIGRLRADIEHLRVRFPRIPVLIDELQTYQRVYNPKTGNVTFGASGRKFDDTVISLALATMLEKGSKTRYLGRTARIKLGF